MRKAVLIDKRSYDLWDVPIQPHHKKAEYEIVCLNTVANVQSKTNRQ